MSTLIIPENNKKDLEEIPLNVRNKMTFRPVKHMDDVLNIALQKKTSRGARKARKSR